MVPLPASDELSPRRDRGADPLSTLSVSGLVASSGDVMALLGKNRGYPWTILSAMSDFTSYSRLSHLALRDFYSSFTRGDDVLYCRCPQLLGNIYHKKIEPPSSQAKAACGASESVHLPIVL